MIYINGEEYVFDVSEGLSGLFFRHNIDTHAGVAIAVNGVVIPKSQWDTFSLNDNDRILLIKATQGG